jgi:hypothetical protein
MASSNLDAELIERVVREVMRRLLERGVAVTRRECSAAAGDLKLNDQVVSLETLQGKLEQVRQLRVPSGAVVTPAAKDELNERGIELVRVK